MRLSPWSSRLLFQPKSTFNAAQQRCQVNDCEAWQVPVRCNGVTSVLQQELLPRHKELPSPSDLDWCDRPFMGSPEHLDIHCLPFPYTSSQRIYSFSPLPLGEVEFLLPALSTVTRGQPPGGSQYGRLVWMHLDSTGLFERMTAYFKAFHTPTEHRCSSEKCQECRGGDHRFYVVRSRLF